MEHTAILAKTGIQDHIIHGLITSFKDVECLLPIQFDIVNNLLKSNNFLVESKAGTGKTFGYIVGALNQIDISNKRPQVLIICSNPSHFNQINDMIIKFIENVSDISFKSIEQVHLQDKYEDLITTQIILTYPNILLNLLEKDTKLFEHVNRVIVDEADEIIRDFLEVFEKVVNILNQTSVIKNYGFLAPCISEESVNLISKIIVDLFVIKYA
jgi:superfamily II DNA/RNA helicase